MNLQNSYIPFLFEKLNYFFLLNNRKINRAKKPTPRKIAKKNTKIAISIT